MTIPSRDNSARANLTWTHLLDRSHLEAGEPVWYQCELIGQEHIHHEMVEIPRPLAKHLMQANAGHRIHDTSGFFPYSSRML